MDMKTVKGVIANREVSIETGRVAKQANGAVLYRSGDTVILATVVFARESKEGIDFFPLTVDYREKTYAMGRFPGGYIKREARPSEKEILTSRLIDRPMRPLFPKNYFHETQVALQVLSADGDSPSDITAMNAASAALMVSDSPYNQPLGAVRVGLIEGEFVINPTVEQLESSDLDLVLSGTQDKITMIEAGSNEITEEKMMEAILFGHEEIKKSVALQEELVKTAGKTKQDVTDLGIPEDVRKKVEGVLKGEFIKTIDLPTKEEREAAARGLYEKVLEQFDTEAEDFNETHLKLLFDECEADDFRTLILKEGRRPDARAVDEIRDITCEVSVLPRTHGSSLFTRGQTQSLGVVTLGGSSDQQGMESLDEGHTRKDFVLHYNFPSFSVGECRPNRGPGRREIGHGALAERALKAVIPTQEEFPYTIRVVSEILESNGSSSQASVCSGTLALMDAGVPIKAPVSGIALGLVTDGDQWKVLTDIAGIEDHHGDMDFKAAGTRKGLTALQMDLKIEGVTEDMLKGSFEAAKKARFSILDKIEAAMPEARKELSAHAPKTTIFKAKPDKIGEIIGPSGKNIKKLVEETGANINIEDDGSVYVSAVDSAAVEDALERIKMISHGPDVGTIYQAKVVKLMSFGAFCEIAPGKDGLVHVSEVTEGFAKAINDYVRIGDVVPVKILEVDERGKVSLSIKQAKEGGMPELPADVERSPITESAPAGGRRGGPRGRR